MKATIHGTTTEGKSINISSDEIVAIEDGKIEGSAKIICKTREFYLIGQSDDVTIRWKKSYMPH